MDNDQKRIREELEAEAKQLEADENLIIPKLEKQIKYPFMYDDAIYDDGGY